METYVIQHLTIRNLLTPVIYDALRPNSEKHVATVVWNAVIDSYVIRYLSICDRLTPVIYDALRPNSEKHVATVFLERRN